MFNSFKKISILIFSFIILLNNVVSAEVVKEINVEGNQRISIETIKMFADVSINDDLTENDLNEILKRLYNTNFFDLVSVKISNKILSIKVKENPIIQNISYDGIKSSKMLEDLKKNILLRPRSSFNKILLEEDKKKIKRYLKDIGYYFSEINISIERLTDNKVNINYDITLGEKAKIKKKLGGVNEEFALPKYPAQTDIKFKEDDWVIGDPEKAYEYDTSKTGDQNMDIMNDLVDKERDKMK